MSFKLTALGIFFLVVSIQPAISMKADQDHLGPCEYFVEVEPGEMLEYNQEGTEGCIFTIYDYGEC